MKKILNTAMVLAAAFTIQAAHANPTPAATTPAASAAPVAAAPMKKVESKMAQGAKHAAHKMSKKHMKK
jgi:hypothetical protein